jgi:outer membrane lipoprotein-sorting protein
MPGFIVSVLIIISLLCTLASAKQDVKSVLEGIRAKYGSLPGLTLTYEREVVSKTMAMLGDEVRGDLATGKMFFKPPLYLKLEQSTPSNEIILSDENNFWWYIPDQKRVYKYSAKDFGKELRILSNIFQGLIDVDDKFKTTLKDSEAGNGYCVELKPVAPWQSIDHLILMVTDEYVIKNINIHYQLGSITIFTVDQIKPVSDFKEDTFIFNIPEGVELIEEKDLDLLQQDTTVQCNQ